MLIKVIFTDGSQGMIKAARLVEFIRTGDIAAYKPFENWVEMRRNRNYGYMGPERRATALKSTIQVVPAEDRSGHQGDIS